MPIPSRHNHPDDAYRSMTVLPYLEDLHAGSDDDESNDGLSYDDYNEEELPVEINPNGDNYGENRRSSFKEGIDQNENCNLLNQQASNVTLPRRSVVEIVDAPAVCQTVSSQGNHNCQTRVALPQQTVPTAAESNGLPHNRRDSRRRFSQRSGRSHNHKGILFGCLGMKDKCKQS